MKKVLEENIAFLIKLKDTMAENACTIRNAMKKIVNSADFDELNRYYRIKIYINIHGDINHDDSITGLIQQAKDLVSEIDKMEVTYQTKKSRRQDYFDCFRTEISRIASGAFEEYGITTQEAFESFYKKIPATWKNVLGRAETNWNRYTEYNNCSVEELDTKRKEEEKELTYLDAYRTIISKGIKCDYIKLKTKIPMDKLSELLEVFSDGSTGIYLEYNDRRKKKNNPFYEVLIDKADEKMWDILTDNRVEAIEKQIYQQEEKIEMIRQICFRKESAEKEEDISAGLDENRQGKPLGESTRENSDATHVIGEESEVARKRKIAKLKELIAMNIQLDLEIQRIMNEIEKDF